MSVFLSNLDDFITPSQACVNPFIKKSTSSPASSSSSSSSSTTVPKTRVLLSTDASFTEFESAPPSERPNLILARESGKKLGDSSSSNLRLENAAGLNKGVTATVSLNDCLACSGCVTSAETVLVQEQSIDKLMEKLKQSSSLQASQLQSGTQKRCAIIVCISPQSLASLASHFIQTEKQKGESCNVSADGVVADCFLRIATVLKGLGAHYVFDSSCGGDVALMESREEFISRYHRAKYSDQASSTTKKKWDKPPSTIALSSSRIRYVDSAGGDLFGVESNTLQSSSSSPSAMDVEGVDVGFVRRVYDENGTEVVATAAAVPTQPFPMLISNCPGWVCFAEKTQPQAIPYMSTTKSAQQIIGTLVKKILRREILTKIFGEPSTSPTVSAQTTNVHEDVGNKLEGDEIFVVSVQPCFDKKLESSRKDFYHDDIESKEVDLVISTSELLDLITSSLQKGDETQSERHPDGNEAAQSLLSHVTPDAPFGRDEIERLFRNFSSDGSSLVSAADSNGGSGGYLEYIARYAADKQFQENLWGHPLQYCVGRNQDVAEVSIGGGALRFGKAYGFRNIQSLMMKMKKGACDLAMVEVMACPSGCLNGGGQLRRHGGTLTDAKTMLNQVDVLFHTAKFQRPDDSPLVKYIYSPELLQGPFSQASVGLFHTRFHCVPKLEEIAPLATKW